MQVSGNLEFVFCVFIIFIAFIVATFIIWAFVVVLLIGVVIFTVTVLSGVVAFFGIFAVFVVLPFVRRLVPSVFAI